MTYNTTNRERVEHAVELMPGCTRKDIAKLYTNSKKRLKWLEYYLPRLVEEGRIHQYWYKRKLVYTKRKKRGNYTYKIPHDRICVKALLRLKVSANEVQFYSESYFRGLKLGAIPEWAAWFPSGIVLLFEYSTADNFKRKKTMANKVMQYEINSYRFEEYFKSRPVSLFVLEATRLEVEKFAEEHRGVNFFYIDLDSFMGVGKCDQLDAPIYIWGHDQKSYSLR